MVEPSPEDAVMKKNLVWPAAAGAAALAVAFTLLAPDLPAPERSPAPAAAARPAKLPSHFEPGIGPDTYTIRRAGLQLQLDDDGADMRLTRGTGSSVLSLKLEGAAPRETRPENLLPGVSNYFLGDDPRGWRRGVPHYARVRYVDVYPGIDLVYYSADGELEYDFLLAPGADAARIRMSYEGAHAMHVDDAGDLRIAIDGGEVVHRKPLTYQVIDGARRMVDSAFRILHEAGGDIVSFSLGNYDARQPLTIDPVLSYATYLGGTDDSEELHTMVVDAAGALYVAGHTNSVNFPVTAGVVQPARSGGFDAFVAKLNPAGTAFEYVTYLGGTGIEEAHRLRVDAAGNAYLAGETFSANFPVTAGAAQTTFGGIDDVFVAKLNATGGALLYATYLGGSGGEPANSGIGGFEIDAAGDAYVYATTDSTDLPVSGNAPQPTRGIPNFGPFDQDAFLTRINAAGTQFTFSTYLGGTGIEEVDDNQDGGRYLAIDGAGGAWVAGTTESADFPVTAGAFDTTFNGPAGGNPGGGDQFVAQYDTDSGARGFVTYVGGSGDDIAMSLAVDGSGNSYVAGWTLSNNFPLTPGAPDTTYGGGGSDGVLFKLNAAGSSLVYSTYLSGGLNDVPRKIHLGSGGALTIAGDTRSSDFPATAGAADATHNGGYDGFVARLNAGGTAFDYVTFAGSSGDDTAVFLEVDAAGSAYALLAADSGGALVTAGGLPHGGDFDDYFVKVNPTGNAFLDATYIGGLLDDGAFAATLDGQENFYFGGWTMSSNYPVTAGAPQPVKAGAAGTRDTFIAKLSTTPAGPAVQPGSLAFSAATFGVGEAAGNASVTVTRTGGANGAVSVSCSAAALGGDTATAAADFTATTVTLTWADGDAASKSCDIPIGNDTAVENAETFTASLANPVGATLGAIVTATVTIADDDVAPVPQPGTVQFAPTSYNINENGGSVTLTLTRTAGADGAISVSVNSGGGSASAGADYTTLTQTVGWGDGDSANKTVAITVLEDTADEADESITVTLTNASGGAAIGAANVATVTLLDNDATPAPPPPAPPQAQSGNVSGRYGGALDGVLAIMLFGLLAATWYGRRRALRRNEALQAVPLLALTLASFAGAARADDAWYLGARAGVAESTLDAGKLEAALGALGHDVSVSVDDQDPTYALFAGYRWSNGLALETSLFELGEYEVAISGTTASPGALLSDSQRLLADGGRGVSAALAWSWRLGQRFEITPRIGAYYWESRRTVENQAGRITNREFGVDLMGGISFDWRLGERWSLGVGWEAWAAGEHNDVRALTAGLRYSF
jgi:Calx-beta domain-containing protein/beta-propeller repeat-containing protein/OmpA family protein